MKKAVMILVTLAATLGFNVGVSLATSLDFIGPAYTFNDTDGDGFSETLRLGTAFASLVDPASDGIFGDPAWETIAFSDFVLDPSAYESGQTYHFATSSYVKGLTIYDDDQTLLLDAELSVSALQIDGSAGVINPAFEINLTNIEAMSNYVAGSSVLIDQLLDYETGAANFSLQLASPQMSTWIETGQTFQGTYSGSLAPSPTPEPATLLLLGVGLLGIGGAIRRKR